MKGIIYKIENKLNQKVYIGKTYISAEKRFGQHLQEAKQERNSGRPISKALRKYGKDNFSVEVLGRFKQEILEEKEIEFIKKFNSFGKGYNATLGGDGSRYLDFSDEEAIKLYIETKSEKLTAKKLGCCVEMIKRILRKNKIEIQGRRKKIFCIELRKSAVSLKEMAKFLRNEGFTNQKVEGTQKCISRALNQKRKSFLNLTFCERK